MLEPRCTTVHRSMRQTRINTQNMIVFTVEFTRNPLSRRGKIQQLDLRLAHINLRRLKPNQSRRSPQHSAGGDASLPPRYAVSQIVLPTPPNWNLLFGES